MRHETFLYILAFSAMNHALPVRRSPKGPVRILYGREVPQEHSHNTFLASVRTSLAANNPDNIQDPVFGLLGNAAAAAGQGSIIDTDCLHQATADQAFTNAKAAGDVAGMTNALIYAALERNTGKVGQASVWCTAIKAKNPEIGAISQHQASNDPASPGAAAKNKAITLELAKQIASVGGDPQEALKSGTFAPGDVNDPTAKGNTCDTVDDEPGCIFTQNLLVEDVTAEEIDAAVAGVSTKVTTAITGASKGISTATLPGSTSGPAAPFANTTTNGTSSCGSAASSASAPISTGSSTATGTNVQTFTGSLGGAPPPVTSSALDRPFSVNGATFVNAGAALQRSCAIQHNACANAANSGNLAGGVKQCDEQEAACNAASAPKKYRKRALDFGSCSDPSIKFAEGLDGRKEASFAPVNTADFNHGSALNIGVIGSFACQQLQDKCKAGAETVAACAKGQADAGDLKGQDAADAFNAALGERTTTTSTVTATEASGSVVASTGNSACIVPSSTPKAPTSTSTPTAAIEPSTAASPTTTQDTATGTNVQTFTGALGGLPPPVIQSTGDRPFSVKGNTFVNIGAALQRSCAVQHNACADAANSGALDGGVRQCEVQEKECNDAAAKE